MQRTCPFPSGLGHLRPTNSGICRRRATMKHIRLHSERKKAARSVVEKTPQPISLLI
jgi:hypothetical protein